MNHLQQSVDERFTSRSRFVAAAIRAHLNRDFASSIPLLLIQAEGMCVELSDAKLFSRKNGMPVIARRLGSLRLDDFMDSFLHPLSLPTALTATQTESLLGPQFLNRHEILHGRSTDYDSLLNSLKCLSLVQFTVTFLHDAFRERMKM
jgi:hypothetical protein